MKQTVTIEVDVPSGMELTGEYRSPRVGEYILSESGKSTLMKFTLERGEWPILRPIWQPPSWLKPGWIACDSSGTWYWYAGEPTRDGCSMWCADGSAYRPLTESGGGQFPHFDFTPPPCADWKQSLRRIGPA